MDSLNSNKPNYNPEPRNLEYSNPEYSKKDAAEASLEMKAYFIDEAFAELDSAPGSGIEPPNKMINICLEKHAGHKAVGKEEELMQNIRHGQNMVAEFVVSSNLRGAEIEQRKVVDKIDQIPTNVPDLKLSCVDELLEHTNAGEDRTKLESYRGEVVKQLALPFTERIKLASILVEENKLAEAEKTLKEATRINLHPQVKSPTIDRLRKFAYTKAFELELTRLMPTFISSNFGRIDTNNNHFLSRTELSQQLANNEYTGVERGILQYMIQNFDTIKSAANDQRFNEKAISLKDVNTYFSNTRPYEFR